MGEQDVNSLLTSVDKVITEWLKRHESNEIRGEAFNVFSLCGVDHYELWHSKILAEFLNPGGSHGQGAQFLQSFAKMFQLGCVFSDDTSVSTEVTSYIKDLRIGRFDILIEDIANKSVCIIENKIFAGEQEEQLDRYHEWLEANRGGWNSCLVFLTLDGHMSATMSDKNQYLRIAYVSDTNHLSLADWIEECANSVKEIPRLCYTFVQYKDHIQKLANGDKAMNEQLMNTFRDKMAAAQAIYENYKNVCIRKANQILKELVLSNLNNDNNNGEWRAEGTCDFSHKEAGILFIPPTSPNEKLCAHIFVVFEETNLSQCQVALWQNVSDINESIMRLTDDHRQVINDILGTEWKVAKASDNKASAWPLWRGIRASENDKNDFGIDWNGDFFDKMSCDNSFKEYVISDIVSSIKKLYKFQKAYSKQK